MAENKNQGQQNQPREVFQGWYEFWKNLWKGTMYIFAFIGLVIGGFTIWFLYNYYLNNTIEVIFTKIIWGIFILLSIYFSFVLFGVILSALVDRVSLFINKILNPSDFPTLPIGAQENIQNGGEIPKNDSSSESRGGANSIVQTVEYDEEIAKLYTKEEFENIVLFNQTGKFQWKKPKV